MALKHVVLSVALHNVAAGVGTALPPYKDDDEDHGAVLWCLFCGEQALRSLLISTGPGTYIALGSGRWRYICEDTRSGLAVAVELLPRRRRPAVDASHPGRHRREAHE